MSKYISYHTFRLHNRRRNPRVQRPPLRIQSAIDILCFRQCEEDGHGDDGGLWYADHDLYVCI